MFSSAKRFFLAASGLIVVLVIWYAVYSLGLYNILLVPSPFEVFTALINFLTDKEFLLNLVATLARITTAFAVSAAVGISAGLLFGYYNLLDNATKKLVDFWRSVPGIVLFPLFILLCGIGNISRLLTAIFVAIPIILINTKYGVLNSNRLRKNFSKIYKISSIRMFYKVILPEASPYIFTGAKVALSLIIILIIVTEMLVGTKYGLGHLLIISQYQFDTAAMYALIIVLGMIGLMLNSSFDEIEKKVFHWRQ